MPAGGVTCPGDAAVRADTPACDRPANCPPGPSHGVKVTYWGCPVTASRAGLPMLAAASQAGLPDAFAGGRAVDAQLLQYLCGGIGLFTVENREQQVLQGDAPAAGSLRLGESARDD